MIRHLAELLAVLGFLAALSVSWRAPERTTEIRCATALPTSCGSVLR